MENNANGEMAVAGAMRTETTSRADAASGGAVRADAMGLDADMRASGCAAEGATAGSVFTVRGLSFAYDHGRVPIFDGLDVTVPEGRITTLIGANGSGKSTLFNLLTKNFKPTGGTVHLRGGDVADLRLRDFARLVAIVHQRNSAPGDLAVEKLVGYGRFPYHGMGSAANTEEDERMVAWALEVTGLTEYAKRPVSALSGGQAQRVWIAMALAQGSDVLLLDEPTTYLDIRYQLDILHLVKRLNSEFGMTVVMVLHDVNQALRYSDNLVALAGGRIVAQGAPDDIITSDLLEEVYGVRLPVATIEGKPFVLAV
ncbi:ABC transporter ATP-binding protein [uncultured Senegalimassilia sp.]|uniref:ABC transporter ATP-binding protein n=1 Tax=uncultured Senegalimassilia sp. TaxID=1714350 RepID=UPI0025E95B82|nr:ABC transporter ATP-binding protein [uncultured Senegalimassilia sp.]